MLNNVKNKNDFSHGELEYEVSTGTYRYYYMYDIHNSYPGGKLGGPWTEYAKHNFVRTEAQTPGLG